MEFKVGDNVIITPPKTSIFYAYCGAVGSITKVCESRNGFFIDIDGESSYWPISYISHIEDDENIEPLDIMDMIGGVNEI